jgi:hypothetical protein
MAGSNGDLSEAEVLALAQRLSPEAKTSLLIQLLEELGGSVEDVQLVDEDDLWWDDDEWEEDEFAGDGLPILDRRERLAAEVFGYSYIHYAERVEMNARFSDYMPEQIDILEQAERDDWADPDLAREMEIEQDAVPSWRQSLREAVQIVDAPTAAESFLRGVRLSIQHALEDGLEDEDSIDDLVGEIGYRAADLSYLLDAQGQLLSEYADELRGLDSSSEEDWDEDDEAWNGDWGEEDWEDEEDWEEDDES